MSDITRYEKRLLAGHPYRDPRVNAAWSMRRRLTGVQHLLVVALIVALLAARFGRVSFAVVVAVAGAVVSASVLLLGSRARDRIHASSGGSLARTTAHLRAVEEATAVRYRPYRREIDRIMVATRPMRGATRKLLRRETMELADRARALRAAALHAGVAVAELPTRRGGAVRWGARPEIVAGPDRRRWNDYEAAMGRIEQRLADIQRAALDLRAAADPGPAADANVHALDAQLAREAAIAEIEETSSAIDPLTAIHDRLTAERFAHDRIAELRRGN